MKIAIFCIITLTCTLIGFEFSASLRRRVTYLTQLQRALLEIEDAIGFLLLPLKEIYARLALEPGAVGALFQNAAPGDSASFEKALSSIGDLTRSDREILSSLGTFLGSSDRDNQLKNLQLCQKRLEENLSAAKENRKTNGRLYQSLGVLGGLFLAIVLL